MSATFALFTRWQSAKGFPTVTAAAKALHLHQTAVTHWKNGRNGSAAVIERMAKDLGEDPVPVILQAFAEAARDAEDKRTLGRLARRLGAACVALLALAPWMIPSNAQAAHTAPQNGSAYTLCALQLLPGQRIHTNRRTDISPPTQFEPGISVISASLTTAPQNSRNASAPFDGRTDISKSCCSLKPAPREPFGSPLSPVAELLAWKRSGWEPVL